MQPGYRSILVFENARSAWAWPGVFCSRTFHCDKTAAAARRSLDFLSNRDRPELDPQLTRPRELDRATKIKNASLVTTPSDGVGRSGRQRAYSQPLSADLCDWNIIYHSLNSRRPSVKSATASCFHRPLCLADGRSWTRWRLRDRWGSSGRR